MYTQSAERGWITPAAARRCVWNFDIPAKVGPASWPVGNVEQAFQPATPTFLSAQPGQHFDW